MTRRVITIMLVVAALLACAATAPAAPAAPPATVAPGRLTVGVALPSEGFQVGVVKDTNVLYARGLEIDLARALATRLGLTGGAAFYQSPLATLLAPGAKPWDLALAQATITAARARNVDFSVPYMRVDQGVLTSQFLRTTPRSIAGLRRLHLCAESGTTGADIIDNRIRPTNDALAVGDVPTLLLYLQLGRCDAIVSDLPSLATLKERAPRRYGVLAGLIRTGEQYGAVLPRGSALTPAVNAAITALRADGTLARLQRRWLSVNLSQVRTLR